ncbi:MAG: PAS-domain containing protein, partial [Gammaproteobacteria bacterium]|nr:PAS-domain containing protein [Gammaproteobacteria bacterium]
MNDDDFLLPNDNLERQNQKLREINRVLIERLERESERNSANGVNFHSTIVLNNLITERTSELESALEMLNQSNARLERANRETELARANLANALEAVQEGFALFDADECLIMRNSRFAEMLPDIKTLIVPGMHFERYIQIVARSRYIKLNDETPLEWTERRSTAHRQPHVNFIVPLVDDHWIQVSEQRTPDGGTAILQTNVTEMMRLEHAEREKLLDKQSQLVRTTLDHVDQGICIFDSQDQLAGWNSRLLDLLSLPVTIARNGARVQSFLAYFDRYGVFEASESALIFTDWLRRVRQRRPFRVRLTRANGMILDVSARETPDGGFVASFSDVTSEQRAIKALHDANENLENRVKERTNELARARDEAELANASKTRFVAAASHD